MNVLSRMLPVKTEAKVVVSGIYITESEERPRRNSYSAAEKEGFFARFKKEKKADK